MYSLLFRICLATLLLLGGGTFSVSGQTIVSAAPYVNANYGAMGSNSVQQIDDNNLLVLSCPTISTLQVVKYNKKLEVQYKLELPMQSANPYDSVKQKKLTDWAFYREQKHTSKVYCELLPGAQQFVVVMLDSIHLSVSYFNLSDGKQLSTQTLKAVGKPGYNQLTFSRNHNYLMVCDLFNEYLPKAELETMVFDLVGKKETARFMRSAVSSKKSKARKNEDPNIYIKSEMIALTNAGTVVTGRNTDDEQVEFICFGKEGTPSTPQAYKVCSLKHVYFNNYTYVENTNGNGLLLVKLNDDDATIDAWTVDYQGNQCNKAFSFAMDADFLRDKLSKNMYHTVAKGVTMEKIKKANVKDANIFAQLLGIFDVQVSKKGDIVIGLQMSQYYRQGDAAFEYGLNFNNCYYIGKNIVLLSLTNAGTYQWSAHVDEYVQVMDGNICRPNHTGVTPVLSLNDTSVSMINMEQEGWLAKFFQAYRKFDLQTGNLLDVRSILPQPTNSSNINYFQWLAGNNGFAWVCFDNANYTTGKTTTQLQVVEF